MAELQHITPDQIAQYGVIAAPDRLTGRAEDNKKIFDRLVRELVAVVVNSIIDKTNELLTAEDVREDNEKDRVAAELLRVEAENLRVQAESARVTSEQDRVQAEAARVAAELLRVQAENLRVTAEQSRVTAENARVIAEQAREQAEKEREDSTKGIVAQATAQAQAAERSATSAASSASAAEDSATSADNAKASAENSAAAAASSASSAGNSASSAAGSAGTASTKSSEAAASAAAASASETNAKASENAAKESQIAAKTSETAAAGHANDAEAAQQAIENMTVSVKTLAPGSAATATKTTAGGVVNIEYGIPRGEQGQGLTIYGYYSTIGELEEAVPFPKEGAAYGVGVIEPYDIYVWDAIHSTWKNNGPIQGPAGPQGENGLDGKAATVRAGTVTTGEPGSQASVSNGGTESDAVFNFTIPRGADGRDGAEGPAGADGKSAYQSAKEQGYTGTEAEFYAALVSLQNAPFLPLSGGTITGGLQVNYIAGIDGGKFDTGGINVTGSFTTDGNVTVDLKGCVINGVNDPVKETDAANKGYVDDLVGNINTVLDTINGEVV